MTLTQVWKIYHVQTTVHGTHRIPHPSMPTSHVCTTPSLRSGRHEKSAGSLPKTIFQGM
ncbi:predicted protein [Plenodomus lingam JN3]|uniref:Predicted protein n=1 Tax=Leptosphaeria maculans (strain JN3 / isolate v23.1.3 / race Av1-4-5-6-7-8) TaxID=985895 RepID=E4ZJ42_LEPMJ|nr:predicted protein [Plenodomus lingam JN3]CBX91473.1 predicted protein [Plenodomus lingam JN3]